MPIASRRNIITGSASFLVGFAAGSIPTAKAAVTVRRVDPIFPAIERSRGLWLAHVEACGTATRVSAAHGRFSQEALSADIRQRSAADAHLDHLDELLMIVPTTPTGLVAYIDHIEADAGFRHCEIPEQQCDAILATIKAAVVRQMGA